MSIQIKARAKAFWHIVTKERLFSHEHDIFRIYSWFGLMTHRVFCMCGEEFTVKKPHEPPVDFYIEQIKLLRDKAGWNKRRVK